MKGAGSIRHPEIPLPPGWPPLVTYECEACKRRREIRGTPAPLSGYPLWEYDEPAKCECGGRMWAPRPDARGREGA